MEEKYGKYKHRLGHIMIYCETCKTTIKSEIHEPFTEGFQNAICPEGHKIRIDDLDPKRFERFNP